MFCPKCGTENDPEQKYCRRCGQSLTAVRLALEGRVDQTITTLLNEMNPARYWIRVAIIVFLLLTALATLVGQGRVGIVNLGSAALILIITLLFFLQLLLKTRRAARLLNPEDRSITGLEVDAEARLTEATTVALPGHLPEASSITEQTTNELELEKRVGKQERER